MKKYLILFICLFCLTGCDKKGTINCTLSSKDVITGYELQSNYKINYKGKYVLNVETEEIVTSDSEDVLDYFENQVNTSYNALNEAYGGYNINVTREDNKLSSKVIIDYSKMNIEQYVTDSPTLKEYTENNKMLKDGVVALYESLGATCGNK